MPSSEIAISGLCEGAIEKRFLEFLSTSEPILTSCCAVDEFGAPVKALFKWHIG